MTEMPIYTKVFRWERSMPQYTCGHLKRLQQIREIQNGFKGLYLTGAAYEGIGIPDCIREGSRIGQEMAESFA
jgi:oxygen-dependent protoporphyrinogen oxidase